MISQFDGNASFVSDSSENTIEEPLNIPVHTGFRPTKMQFMKRKRTLTTIKKCKKVAEAQFLPRITVYNARSLFPKIESLITDIIERKTDVCCISEIWEDKGNKKSR